MKRSEMVQKLQAATYFDTQGEMIIDFDESDRILNHLEALGMLPPVILTPNGRVAQWEPEDDDTP